MDRETKKIGQIFSSVEWFSIGIRHTNVLRDTAKVYFTIREQNKVFMIDQDKCSKTWHKPDDAIDLLQSMIDLIKEKSK